MRKLPNFKNNHGKIRSKDYIKNPKDDGYRSYHLVGVFLDDAGEPKNIELQLRTRIQHYWATTLEIVDLFTDQALKSNQGDETWKAFFIHVSKQFAAMDSIHIFGSYEEQTQYTHYKNKIKSNQELLKSCLTAQDLCKRLDVFKKLNAFAGSLKVIGDQLDEADKSTGYVLLKIDVKEHKVYSNIFSIEESGLAEGQYIAAEKEASSKEDIAVALVSTAAVGNIREAYPNYFADASEFILYLDYIANIKATWTN